MIRTIEQEQQEGIVVVKDFEKDLETTIENASVIGKHMPWNQFRFDLKDGKYQGTRAYYCILPYNLLTLNIKEEGVLPFEKITFGRIFDMYRDDWRRERPEEQVKEFSSFRDNIVDVVMGNFEFHSSPNREIRGHISFFSDYQTELSFSGAPYYNGGPLTGRDRRFNLKRLRKIFFGHKWEDVGQGSIYGKQEYIHGKGWEIIDDPFHDLLYSLFHSFQPTKRKMTLGGEKDIHNMLGVARKELGGKAEIEFDYPLEDLSGLSLYLAMRHEKIKYILEAQKALSGGVIEEGMEFPNLRAVYDGGTVAPLETEILLVDGKINTESKAYALLSDEKAQRAIHALRKFYEKYEKKYEVLLAAIAGKLNIKSGEK